MSWKKNIFIVLLIVIFLAGIIEFIRLDFVTKLNKNDNIALIDIKQNKGIQTAGTGLNNESTDKYLIIYENNKEYLKVKENIDKVLDYVKIGHDAVEVSDVSNINNQYKTVILILENLDGLRNSENLFKFVFEGGNLFVAFRWNSSSSFYNIYRKLGIIEFSGFYDATGIRLLDNVLIKGQGLEVGDVGEEEFIVNSSMSLRIDQECEEYAESINGQKLLWKKKYGQGNIIYFNGTTLGDKKTRGFILGSLSLLDDNFIYPIINSKVSFIDDFPAPVPGGSNEKISEEYGRTIPRFYKDIWWPNMLEVAARYSLKYSGVIIGTYNDKVENIEPGSTDLDPKDLIYFGRELLSHGGEIGIHGYNHQPLTTQVLSDLSLGYKPWKDNDTMVKSIKEVTELARSAFPSYSFQVYVPPSNILSTEGRNAISAAQTGIKIIASLYYRGESLVAYEQEFAIADDGIIECPRITAGYEYSDETIWNMINGITMHGFFSHFVHPDDILDAERTHGKGWSQLVKEFDKYNKMVFDNYPWLRGMTATEGANEMIKYLSMEPRYEKKDESIKVTVNNFYKEASFVLRTQKQIESVQNASAQEIDKNVYLIQSNNPVFQINFKR